jgi:hypothetical protein
LRKRRMRKRKWEWEWNGMEKSEVKILKVKKKV